MRISIAVLACALSVVGCQATSVKPEAAVVPVDVKSKALSKPEIQTMLVGNTYPFSKGGIYLSSETEALAHWDGKTQEATWYATDDSRFCYTVEMFGGEECLELVQMEDGNYQQTYRDKETKKVKKVKTVLASNIKEGKAF